MTIHRTWLNWKEQGFQAEVLSDEDMTEPDMTLSLHELLVRHTQGREIPINGGVHTDEEDDLPDTTGWDMVDIQDHARANMEHIQFMQNELAKPRKKVRKAPEKQAEPEIDEQDDA